MARKDEKTTMQVTDVKKPECVAMEPKCKRCGHGRSHHRPMLVNNVFHFPTGCWACIGSDDPLGPCERWDCDDVQWIGQQGFAQAAEDIFSGLRHVYRCCVS